MQKNREIRRLAVLNSAIEFRKGLPGASASTTEILALAEEFETWVGKAGEPEKKGAK